MAIVGDEDIFGQTGITKYPNNYSSANKTGKITLGPAEVNPYANQGWNEPTPAIGVYPEAIPGGIGTPWAPNARPAASPAQSAPAQEQAAPAPPSGGATAYRNMDSAGRAAADQSWLGGDSDYTAQLGEYERALQDFIGRITAQKQGFDTDANNALDATNKNEVYAGNQLGEDFGARGMSYSGLFDKSKNDLGTRYADQRTNIDLVRGKNKSDADNRQADYQAENNIGRANAKRSALGRMAQNQQIIDQGAGL